MMLKPTGRRGNKCTACAVHCTGTAKDLTDFSKPPPCRQFLLLLNRALPGYLITNQPNQHYMIALDCARHGFCIEPTSITTPNPDYPNARTALDFANCGLADTRRES